MPQFDFGAIGTTWHIDVYQEISDSKKSEIFGYIQNRIEIFDKAYSRFRSDSLVTEMSQKSGEYVLPDDAICLI